MKDWGSFLLGFARDSRHGDVWVATFALGYSCGAFVGVDGASLNIV